MHIQDDGFKLHLAGEEVTIHGAVVCLCGDIPASNYIGGFKEGVGLSLRKCRRCMATATDMDVKVTTLFVYNIAKLIFGIVPCNTVY